MSFLRIDGQNGGTFFFSLNSFDDWRKSLEFYHAVSVQAKCKKTLLMCAYLWLKMHPAVSSAEAGAAIQQQLQLGTVPIVPDNGSAMISPTRDKAVIHHHGRGYEKFAVGQSLIGVRREMAIYRKLAETPPTRFLCSKLSDAFESAREVHFFLHYAPGHFSEWIPAAEELRAALEEFHQITGLAHGDFKPWNVKWGEKPLFFDFEAAHPGSIEEDMIFYENAKTFQKR